MYFQLVETQVLSTQGQTWCQPAPPPHRGDDQQPLVHTVVARELPKTKKQKVFFKIESAAIFFQASKTFFLFENRGGGGAFNLGGVKKLAPPLPCTLRPAAPRCRGVQVDTHLKKAELWKGMLLSTG